MSSLLVHICSFVLLMGRNCVSERTDCWIKIQCLQGAGFGWQRSWGWLTVGELLVGISELAPRTLRPSLWRVFSLELPPIRMGFQRQGIWVFSRRSTRVLGEARVSRDQEPSQLTGENWYCCPRNMGVPKSAQLGNLDWVTCLCESRFLFFYAV